MFKANLIDNPAYYTLRRNLVLLGLPGAFLIGIWFGQTNRSSGWLVVIACVMAGFTIWRIRLVRKATAMSRNRKIQITPKEISIMSRKGDTLEIIPVQSISKFTIKDVYTVPEENFQEFFRNMKGRAIENYMIIHLHNKTCRFDFTLDSYYMIEQLKKVIEEWKRDGEVLEFTE